MSLFSHRLPELVEAIAKRAGFVVAGVTDIQHSYSERDAKRVSEFVELGRAGEMEYLKRRNEQEQLLRTSASVPFPWAKSIILCAANYNSAQPKSIEPAEPDRGWIARYAWSSREEKDGSRPPSDYHKILLKRLRAVEAELKAELGEFESRCFVDTGPLVERNYARSAGLGWIGKNACLINQEFGSWLFLGTILTSLELPPDSQSVLPPDRCGTCQRCLEACPTGALTAPHVMDASLCISYLTIEKRGEIPTELRDKMGRQIFGCDICQDVCPWNRKAPVADDPGLRVRQELVNPTLEWLGRLDEAEFNRLFNGSPIRRAGWNCLRRNIAIAMANSGLESFLPQLRRWAESEEEVNLKETARWAIQKLEKTQSEGSADGGDNGLPCASAKEDRHS